MVLHRVRLRILASTTMWLVFLGCGSPPASPKNRLLPPSAQLEVREGWLETRHGMLLEMMRRHGVSMWVVVNEEFHDDPLTEFVAPPLTFVGNRDLFIFIDAGEAGLRRVAITGYAGERLKRFFESPDDPRPADEVLPELLAEHHPRTIALSIGARRGVTRSLTRASFRWLSEIMGPEARASFISAADLIEEYLDTRIPAEYQHYRQAVELTSELGERAFSNEVVIPGKTTVGEIRSWLLDRYWEFGVTPWFDPDIRVQRRGMENPTSRGFLAVAPDAMVIERGDLLHLDIGFTYMGLNTDWQKMAYVLAGDENDAPEGLKNALSKANDLWAFMSAEARPEMAAGEIYSTTITEMERLGIEAMIYCHPLGNQGHGLGARIDFRAAKQDHDQPEAQRLRSGSYLAFEFNIADTIPEWDDQKVWIMQEDPAHQSDDGWQLFVPRQEAFYLIN
ncbi:MAG: M24 family metallopeptidase [Thermoanaerobaculales bacterium]